MEENKSVKCPFYRHHERHGIICEGPEDEGTLQLNFPARKKRGDFMDRYCRSMSWEQCPVAKLLCAKYE